MESEKELIKMRRNRKRFLLWGVVITGALLLFLGIYSVKADTNPPDGSIQSIWARFNWHLVFDDQFNGPVLDPNKWVTCYWWNDNGCTNQANNELEWYQPGNVVLKDGYLLLVAKPETVQGSKGKTYQYTSGMVTTGKDVSNANQPSHFAFTYGFIQVKAWVPSGKGIWPAIWLLPADESSLPEIDVMEIRGNEPGVDNMTLHYKNNDGTEGVSQVKWNSTTVLSEGWHTFAIDWEPNAIIWYVDGIERRQFTDQTKIPSTPMYLLINLAVGGDWPGNPDKQTIFPSIFTIDSVQIWERNSHIHLARK